VANLTFSDEASEFRIAIAGQFCGPCVAEAELRWQRALSEVSARRITIDISSLAGYENSGRNLLRRMHRHGAAIAAATPRSLIFLAEITAARRLGPIPSLIPKAPAVEQKIKPSMLAAKKASAGGS
jgi:hypothetical protein